MDARRRGSVWRGGWEKSRVGWTWCGVSRERAEGIGKEKRAGESLGERTRASWLRGLRDRRALHLQRGLGKRDRQVDSVLAACAQALRLRDFTTTWRLLCGWRERGARRQVFFSRSASFGRRGQQLVGEDATLWKQNLLNCNLSFWSTVVLLFLLGNSGCNWCRVGAWWWWTVSGSFVFQPDYTYFQLLLFS